ncbi:phosphatase PAP2 family protein [Streptomyces abyssomicinicus]|uniref:phosphatase PAP2 family protein n=1 Tax=Streptomyces abyssomicinicus TaxID=574929 RepID=UPI001250BC28|nr:phosphatase PAP2 family protein [Streptomyces abyssomicinicus]
MRLSPHAPPLAAPSAPHRRLHDAALRTAAFLAFCSLVLLALVEASWQPLIAMDTEIARTTHRWAVDEDGLTAAFRVLTDWVWDPLTLRALTVVVAVWLVWRRSQWWPALWLVAVVAVAALLQQVLKAVVDRPRPVWPDPVDHARYAAFPSGHAMTAAVCCGLLLWVLHRRGAGRRLWRAAVATAVVSVVGVGLTRVWLGVHWLSDVVGGWLLGAMTVAAAVVIHERLPWLREAGSRSSANRRPRLRSRA